ncbi:oligo-1,6-glucosidase-like [Artemia franciscana]|uniref:alpha-glucosidase n=1 Tax=Artemia franciscana TaxID=6661 RepID=A0AA88HS60_ARTSF|nr:hypothetical protein QYM36_010635 [Artemia franciscana]
MAEFDRKSKVDESTQPVNRKYNKSSLFGGIAMGILFILTMIVLAVCLSEVFPSDPVFPWWQEKLVYRTLIESFQDSDGDGVGDLAGITSRLYYLKELGVGTIWLSNMFLIKDEPQERGTFSYNKDQIAAVNFTEIDPIFGTADNLTHLSEQASLEGMLLAMDLNPLWTSTSNTWFNASRNSQENFIDFYIWSQNNSQGLIEDYNWEFDDIRNQFYLTKSYPDVAVLNFSSKSVVNKLKEVFRYWMTLGVKAFNIGPIHEYSMNLFTEKSCLMEEINGCFGRVLGGKELISYLHENDVIVFGLWEVNDRDVPIPTLTLDGALDFSVNTIAREYFGYHYLGNAVIQALVSWVDIAQSSKMLWMMGNENHGRIVSHTGRQRAITNYVLDLVLPGGPAIYYGEELGLRNNENTASKIEYSRTPMLWTAYANANFSISEPWLPVHGDYNETCIAVQLEDPDSYLNTFKKILELRQDYSGGNQYFTAVLDGFIAFSRYKFYVKDAILVLVNFSYRTLYIDMETYSLEYATVGVVKLSSQSSQYPEGKEISLKNIQLEPNGLLILQYYPATSGEGVSNN